MYFFASSMFMQELIGRLSSFFSGCHLFIPVFDPAYDSFANLSSRTPWCFDAVLAVAGKVRNGSGPPSAAFYKCLEEAQGIARSSLFGPVVRKEAVQGDFQFKPIFAVSNFHLQRSHVNSRSMVNLRVAPKRSCHANGS
jgi:hypothetical protein